jgi:hypothetical protein
MRIQMAEPTRSFVLPVVFVVEVAGWASPIFPVLFVVEVARPATQILTTSPAHAGMPCITPVVGNERIPGRFLRGYTPVRILVSRRSIHRLPRWRWWGLRRK